MAAHSLQPATKGGGESGARCAQPLWPQDCSRAPQRVWVKTTADAPYETTIDRAAPSKLKTDTPIPPDKNPETQIFSASPSNPDG
jgi:hypothetical protein